MESSIVPQSHPVGTEVMKEIEILNDIGSAFMKSQVLLVANYYDLFTRIGEHCLTVDDVAQLLGTDRRATRMLLDALVGLEYLEKQDGSYKNSDVSKRLLVRGSDFYQGDSLRHRYRQWFNWSALREVMKTGSPPDTLVTEYPEPEEHRTRDFALFMANSGRLKAEQLAEQLDIQDTKLLLDLGGGPGAYACAFARKNPDLRVVVYDTPDVCAFAEEQISLAGLSGRVTTLAGDFLTDDLGVGYDLIFVSNIVHIHAPDQIRSILSKCFESLIPGGRIMVKDFFMKEDRSGSLFSLLFAINMLVRTQAGDTYTFDQIEREMVEAGFTSLKRVPFTEQSWLITGEKERGGV